MKKIFSLWLDDSDRQALQLKADKINLSLGAYINRLIKENLKK